MNKALLYFLGAIGLGFLIVFIPLLTFAQVKSGNVSGKFLSLSEGLRGLEGSYALKAQVSGSDAEVLAVSFLVASIVYLLFRRRIPGQDRGWTRMPP
jgi:hypothetical protein